MTIDVGQGLLNALIFMGIPLIPLILFAMWKWERTCRLKIKVLVCTLDGDTQTHYVERAGGKVTIENKKLGIVRTWAINELATINQPYPELGILPRFLQREIQTVILSEGDWEPLLNRSPHRDDIVSPNVLNVLLAANKQIEDEKLKTEIDRILNTASTAPTREMIARPDVLGALQKTETLKAIVNVSDDIMQSLKEIKNQLIRFVSLNPTFIYLGLAAIAGVGIFSIVKVMAIAEEVAKITQYLGLGG